MKKHLAHLLLTALLAAPTFAASPTIVCSGDQTLECTNATGVIQATVQDADGDGLLLVWTINGQAVVTNVLAAGTTTNAITLSLTNGFAMGTNDVSVGVTDDGTNVVSCSSTIIVQDTTPPVIEKLVATPNLIWPPNHKMVCVRLVVKVTDSCGGATWRVASVTSNEAEDAPGSGNTGPDWEIRSDHKVYVRAERSGRGSGRDYTITIEAADDAGNTTSGDVHVLVPHDKGKKKWHEDAEDDDDDDDQGGSGKSHGKDKGKSNGKAKGKNK